MNSLGDDGRFFERVMSGLFCGLPGIGVGFIGVANVSKCSMTYVRDNLSDPVLVWMSAI
jgi:hypothetical protein